VGDAGMVEETHHAESNPIRQLFCRPSFLLSRGPFRGPLCFSCALLSSSISGFFRPASKPAGAAGGGQEGKGIFAISIINIGASERERRVNER